jgi:AbrB family looped-hinge helix DNA binding protein
METTTSRLTRKYQATIPESVRRFLGLEAGDVVAFTVTEDRVELRKARPLDVVFSRSLEGTLGEWASEADDEAYRDL